MCLASSRRRQPLFPLSSVRVENWQADNNIGDFETAELDLRLEAAVHAIYSDQDLMRRLAWKGGTAMNKLFLADAGQYRLSADLDFNAVGRKEEVTRGRFRPWMRQRLVEILAGLDPSSTPKVDHWTYFKDELHWRYQPIATPDSEVLIKIEISTVERFSILGYQEMLRSWASMEPTTVMAVPLEELLATKIRAFYERRKGRDVYDLYRVLENQELNRPRLRKMVLYYYYFFRSGHEFRPSVFLDNTDRKLAGRQYGEDIQPYLRGDDPFRLGGGSEDRTPSALLLGRLGRALRKRRRRSQAPFSSSVVPASRHGGIQVEKLRFHHFITRHVLEASLDDRLFPFRAPAR